MHILINSNINDKRLTNILYSDFLVIAPDCSAVVLQKVNRVLVGVHNRFQDIYSKE